MQQGQGNNPYQDDFKHAAAWAELFADMVTRPLLLLIRHRFGENWLRPALTVAVYGVLGMLIREFRSAANVLSFVFYLTCAAAILHQGAIRLRKWRKEPHVFSYHAGHSRLYEWGLIPFLDHHQTQRFAEPLLALVAGWIVSRLLDAGLGQFLMVSGACLWATESLRSHRWESRIIALLDEQAIARALQRDMTEDATDDPQGVPLPVIAHLPDEERAYVAHHMARASPSLADAVNRLDPALQAFLQPSAEDTGEVADDDAASSAPPDDVPVTQILTVPPKRGRGRPRKPQDTYSTNGA